MPQYPDEDRDIYPELPPRRVMPEEGEPYPPRRAPRESWQPPRAGMPGYDRQPPPAYRQGGGGMTPPAYRRGYGEPVPPAYPRNGADTVPDDWGEDDPVPRPPYGGARPAGPLPGYPRAPEDAYGGMYPRQDAPESRGSSTGRKLCRTLIVICVLILAVCGYTVYRSIRARDLHRQTAAEVYRGTLPGNVYVDNIPVGGMTPEQASACLRGLGVSEEKAVSVTVILPDGERMTFTEKEIPITRNIRSVLREADAGDWTGIAQIASVKGVSPLQYRYGRLKTISGSGAYYYTRITYDPEDVYAAVAAVSERVNRDVKDARAVFDADSRSFTFTDEVTGCRLDAADLFDKMIFMLDNGIYSGEIETLAEQQMPAVTRADLERRGWGLISSYTTHTTDDANRNTNVRLACQAVNGTEVLPGYVFSFNSTTGMRTEEKGYRPAAAIAGGATVDEIGGGVCQVSSTLFNVCAMADLEIVERSPHTWPSTYVDKGRDATVNWPNLDFKFRNTAGYPLYILARYENRTCTVELYGPLLENGVSIGLETVQISETPPPEEPVYERDPSLAPGTQTVKKKARTGYVVETYKVYYYNGYEYDRVLLDTSVYRMIQQVIGYND
ncbi:MAG: hypothetical protein CW338_03515 [Clostridiales bacterium]|nr:hypothetical protein [Clostridiales bacterium]